MDMKQREDVPRRRHWHRLLAWSLAVLSLSVVGWTWWAEGHPRQERRLRVLVQDQLQTWLPEQMQPGTDAWYGIKQRTTDRSGRGPGILLVHGLDEPGDIWDDLLPALDEAGYDARELRYPNDQGIDRSAAYLAAHWPDLPEDRELVLIGHSMGGLVIRAFVTGLTRQQRTALSPGIRGVIMAGTPNQGSEWARLRIWLELRDHLPTEADRRFSLLAALRDGTGAAKIDLRPGSDFLTDLDARPWPADVPLQLIGGVIAKPTAAMTESLRAISRRLGSAALERGLSRWWSTLGEDLGDGVVSTASLELPGSSTPKLVRASHRGMLQRFLPGDPQPPGIPIILGTLDDWRRLEPEGPSR